MCVLGAKTLGLSSKLVGPSTLKGLTDGGLDATTRVPGRPPGFRQPSLCVHAGVGCKMDLSGVPDNVGPERRVDIPLTAHRR
jgi:hypothetical protein